MESARRVVSFIKSQNCLAGIQLAHAGRKASCNPPVLSFWPNNRGPAKQGEGAWDKVVGASAIPFDATSRTPQSMTAHDINDVVNAFGEAARRADQAGFDMVEIHSAHGYLLSSFLSPLSNTRTDQWGGSFEGRTKIVIDVSRAVRAALGPNKPVWLRVSASEYAEDRGGWNEEDSARLAVVLRNEGIDAIDVSSGGNIAGARNAPVGVGPGYQSGFARHVKAHLERSPGPRSMSVVAVGCITQATQAETILTQLDVDFVAIGREFLLDPHWGLKAARELGVDVHWPQQYEWSVNAKL